MLSRCTSPATATSLLASTLPVTVSIPPISALPVVVWNVVLVVPEPFLSSKVLDAPWNTILSSNLLVELARNVPSTSNNPPILTSCVIPTPPATTKSPVVLDVELVLLVSFKLPARIPESVPVKISAELCEALCKNANPPVCPARSAYESS